jgi:hypothetical protein
LAELGYYGGPTLTHALLEGSGAMNAGDDGIAELYGLKFDQRGRKRFFDTAVDLGAVESAFEEL